MNSSRRVLMSNGYRWLNSFHELHRLDGPAVEWSSGEKQWWVDGKLHRLDGPAIEEPDGSKQWYISGRLHRLDGPAVEHANGLKYWYADGKLHRLDGPAIELADGTRQWYINEKWLSEQDFLPAVVSCLLNCDDSSATLFLELFIKKT